VVKKNEYPRKNIVSKDGVHTTESGSSNSPQKSFQKEGEFHHKENYSRNNRPPRENNQARDNNFQQRDNQRKENLPKDNQIKENTQKDTPVREHKENHQRNFHRENTQNRESYNNRESYRQYSQRPAIKPRAEETVEDIAVDIGRIEKEIELELKEIRSLRLGV
jgi:hypothetical protein